MKPKFALIGAAGFVAPRHMKAIKEVGGELIAAVDPHDSVGIIDSYFPECNFFTEIELFDRYLSKLKRNAEGVDYISICSPNYLHDAHCRLALRLGADAICEKPLVLNTRNIDALKEVEKETGKKINCILQLRHDLDMKVLRSVILSSLNHYDIAISYIAPRGKWYDYSWKGDASKSGGIATNIGVHLFDLIGWLFGDCSFEDLYIRRNNSRVVWGNLRIEKSSISFHLSINGKKPKRTMIVNEFKYDLSSSFTNLHIESYKSIIKGEGFGLDDTRFAIKLCEEIRGIKK